MGDRSLRSLEVELSDDAKNFLSVFFSMGPNSSILSNPPHETLNKRRAAYDELKAAGLVIEKPFNRFDVIEITCTPEANEIARARAAENYAALIAPKGGSIPPCDSGGDRG